MSDDAHPSAEPLYLTASEVGDLLRLSPKSVFRLAASDPSMPTLRLNGKTIRWPRERLLVWLRQREQGPGRPRRLAAVRREAGAR